MDISKDRQRLRGLFYSQMRLLQTFLGTRGLVKGGIYKTKLKCGKKGCRCERGELHEVWMFYRSEEGRTKIRTLSKEAVTEYGQYTRSYQRYRQARAELVRLHKEQLRLIDLLEEGLRKENRKIEQKLFRNGR
jgi:uncharacterized protein YjiS (DUF1127 family)